MCKSEQIQQPQSQKPFIGGKKISTAVVWNVGGPCETDRETHNYGFQCETTTRKAARGNLTKKDGHFRGVRLPLEGWGLENHGA